MNTLILVRHGHAASNAAATVNAQPPGAGLSAEGISQARALQRALAAESVDLGVSTRLRRTQETLALALRERSVPTMIEPLLDEIDFGSFEGGPLERYRDWAWEHDAGAACPGAGESRADAARRFAAGLSSLLYRPEETVLAIGHALPIRYALDAADGAFPAARVVGVPHATPFRLRTEQLEVAVETLRAWAEKPQFSDTPFDG